MERLKISELILCREENQIPGNFTSVKGEYYINSIGKTGFYKANGCMIEAQNDEDLRELFAAQVMEQIGFPHATIMPTIDKTGNNGCLSVNILNEAEEFVDPKERNPISTIDDFINGDLYNISTISGITSEDLKARKEYLLKYLLVSALISNTDIKMDNMLIIKNGSTGAFRNPEYYDMGLAFIESNNAKFFGQFLPEQIIKQLYEQYPSQIVPFGKRIEERINAGFIESLLQNEFFNEFSLENRNSIIKQLTKRANFIRELNYREENNFKFGTENIHETTKKTPLQLRDTVSKFMSNLRNKFLGRDRNE